MATTPNHHDAEWLCIDRTSRPEAKSELEPFVPTSPPARLRTPDSLPDKASASVGTAAGPRRPFVCGHRADTDDPRHGDDDAVRVRPPAGSPYGSSGERCWNRIPVHRSLACHTSEICLVIVKSAAPPRAVKTRPPVPIARTHQGLRGSVRARRSSSSADTTYNAKLRSHVVVASTKAEEPEDSGTVNCRSASPATC